MLLYKKEVITMFQELDYKSKLVVMKKYAKSEKGKELTKSLDRLFIYSLIEFISTILIIGAVIFADWNKWWLGVAGIFLITGLVFFVGQLKIRHKEYNKFLTQLNKTEKNKLTKRK